MRFKDRNDGLTLSMSSNRVAIAPSGTGLKKIAPYACFEWEADDAGDEASMLWHHHAVDADEVIRTKLLRYKENDVAAGSRSVTGCAPTNCRRYLVERQSRGDCADPHVGHDGVDE